MPKGIEQALACCLEKIERDNATLEEAMREYPELQGELEPLLKLARDLRALPKVRAPESLRASRRPVFPPHDAHTGVPNHRWRVQTGLRLATAPRGSALARLAAGIALAFFLLGGVAIASANSLPEETLYPVKLALEDLRLAAAPSPQAQAELEIYFAGKRLEEVEAAVRQGRVESAQRGLALYEERVAKLLDRAEPSSTVAAGANPESLQFGLERQQEVLSRVLHQLPEQAQPAALRAMDASKKAQGRVDKRLPEPEGRDSSKVEKATVPLPPTPETAPGVPAAATDVDNDRGPQGNAKGHTTPGAENEGAQVATPAPTPPAPPDVPEKGATKRPEQPDRQRGRKDTTPQVTAAATPQATVSTTPPATVAPTLQATVAVTPETRGEGRQGEGQKKDTDHGAGRPPSQGESSRGESSSKKPR